VATIAKREPAEERSSGFKKEVTLLVLDKVVFGLLIVVAAFLLNRILDQHRARITFEAEFAKVRAERVADILSLQDRRDSVILRLTASELRAVRALHDQDKAHASGSQKELDAATRVLARSALRINEAQDALGRLPKIQPVLDANRFWLGQQLYARLNKHLTLEQRVEARAPVIIGSSNARKLQGDIAEIQELQREAKNPLDIDEMTRILSGDN
jgi:hypothetical protein